MMPGVKEAAVCQPRRMPHAREGRGMDGDEHSVVRQLFPQETAGERRSRPEIVERFGAHDEVIRPAAYLGAEVGAEELRAGEARASRARACERHMRDVDARQPADAVRFEEHLGEDAFTTPRVEGTREALVTEDVKRRLILGSLVPAGQVVPGVRPPEQDAEVQAVDRTLRVVSGQTGRREQDAKEAVSEVVEQGRVTSVVGEAFR